MQRVPFFVLLPFAVIPLVGCSSKGEVTYYAYNCYYPKNGINTESESFFTWDKKRGVIQLLVSERVYDQNGQPTGEWNTYRDAFECFCDNRLIWVSNVSKNGKETQFDGGFNSWGHKAKDQEGFQPWNYYGDGWVGNPGSSNVIYITITFAKSHSIPINP